MDRMKREYLKLVLLVLGAVSVVSLIGGRLIPMLLRRQQQSAALTEERRTTLEEDELISRGLVYKAIALSLADQQSIENRGQSHFWGSSEAWYAMYMDYLYDEGILTEDDVPAVEEAVQAPLTVGELSHILQEFQLDIGDILPVDYGLSVGNGEIFPEEILKLPVRESAWWQCYEAILRKQQLAQRCEVTESTVTLYGSPESVTELSAWEGYTTAGRVWFYGIDPEPYLDRELTVLMRDSIIIRISEVSEDSVTYANCYIMDCEVPGDAIAGTEGTLQLFINGAARKVQVTTEAAVELEERYGDGIADVTFRDGLIAEIVVKTDFIRAKVLSVSDTQVELEGYGTLVFEEEHKIYKTYGVMEQLSSPASIVVGYDLARFVVADGKVCATVITQTLEAQNVRVLLKTTGFTSIYHESVSLTGIDDFTVSWGDTIQTYRAGEIVTFLPTDACFTEGTRVFIDTVQENKGIQVTSITRAQGIPEYQGSIELVAAEDGIVIINDVMLEDYLVQVVPSEMPGNYGPEAAKVQAICARTFACEQIQGNHYREYGAHLDDSDQFQVYNNVYANEVSTAGIRQTYGQILEYEGNPAGTYYFSTSCGATTDLGVWSDNPAQIPYMQSKLVAGDGTGELNLTEEETFAAFITDTEYGAYEQDCDWFRWNTAVSLDMLTEVINGKLAAGAVSDPSVILVKETGTEQNFIGKPAELTNIGEVQEIRVVKRISGGSVDQLQIEGSQYTLLVKKATNIRMILGSEAYLYHNQNAEGVQLGNTFASSFFCAVPQYDEAGEHVTGYTFYGGGRGHGVGMSQNGVHQMSMCGYTYDSILAFFYPGTELIQLY